MTSGTDNTGMGYNSVQFATSSQNTGVGSGCLKTVTTGGNNTGIGYGADVTSGGVSNAIAVGYNANVSTSNTAVIGNSSITDVYFGSTSADANTHANKLYLATGSNKSIGTATLAAGTVTVSTTAVTSTSIIMVTVNTPGGTRGYISAPAASIVSGTSFVINSTSGSETSTVNWWIIN